MSESALHVPTSLDEALSLRQQYGRDITVMGGGTLLMQGAAEGHLIGKRLMSLQRVGLDGIDQANGAIRLGATTRVKDIAGLQAAGVLTGAASTLGGPAVRNMATVGGNLFVQPPWGDMTAALLVLDTIVELQSQEGKRSLPLAELLESGCDPKEVVAAVAFRKPAGRTVYAKLRRRRANSPAIVSVALHLDFEPGQPCRSARLALIGANRKVIRSKAAEAELEGKSPTENVVQQAAQAAMDESSPFTDALATDWYRRKMIGVFVRRALEQALDGNLSSTGEA